MNDEPRTVALSVVAPMFNEESAVEQTVDRVREGLDGLAESWEFVMVNDGSTDGTLAVAEAAAAADPRVRVVGYDQNRGRGKALRTGFAAARGDVVVTVDYDLSYSADQVVRLFEELRDHPEIDVVLGSAYMPGGATVGVPAGRLFVSKLGNHVLSLAFGGRFHTISCVFRGYRRRVLEALDLHSDGKEIHLEILAQCTDGGFRIREVPATLRARVSGRPKFRLMSTMLTHLLFAFSRRPLLFSAAIVFGLAVVALSVVAIAQAL